MERSEIIPQTKADLGSGHLFYHFSLSTEKKNTPNPAFEHQIAFFEVRADAQNTPQSTQLTIMNLCRAISPS